MDGETIAITRRSPALSEKELDDGIVHAIGNNGTTWSSARAVKCTVKSGNERNPHSVLNVHGKLPAYSGRKVGMTSNQHGPYALGYTRATMAGTMGR